MMMTPLEVAQNLIRFDTTNPPGNEKACIEFIDDLLTEAGLETTLLARDENRPNLIARLKGSGEAPPLLFQGHVDVVTTEGQGASCKGHTPLFKVQGHGILLYCKNRLRRLLPAPCHVR